jgi:hypothetical protein
MLVPRALDTFARWRNVPLPPVRGETRALAAERGADEKRPGVRAAGAAPPKAARPRPAAIKSTAKPAEKKTARQP